MDRVRAWIIWVTGLLVLALVKDAPDGRVSPRAWRARC
jgi:hypothetical protein